MAFSKLEKALALAVGLDIAAPGTSRKAATAAVKLITSGTARAAPVVSRGITGIAAANPVATGIGLGLGALQTPPGQALLDAAAARGAADRIAAQQAFDEAVFRAQTQTIPQVQAGLTSPAFKPAVKRKVSKYAKAVKAGMAAVKKSKFGGKPGNLTNVKATFSTVSKVASAINKGRKVAKTGIRGSIGRAVRKVLK